MYDMTHDNPSFLDRLGNRSLHLPVAALLASGDWICASTWGYDQMNPKNFDVVTENRLYPIQSRSEVSISMAKKANFECQISIRRSNCKRVRVAG